jgi:branched-chain amino acid transport system ATP-binding protein
VLEDILVTDKLSVRLGGVLALEDVSVQVPQGKTYAIVGREGAGKFAFLRLLSGHLKPSDGMILYKGSEISTLDPLIRIRLGIGSAFSPGSIEPRLTLLENVKWAVQNTIGVRYQLIRHYKSYDDSEHKAYQCLSLVGLEEKYSSLASELNHGERKKLELAITLGFDPTLMLLHEPTANMTEKEAADILDILLHIKNTKDITILMNENRASVLRECCDEVLIFEEGRFIAQKKPEEILSCPFTPFLDDIYFDSLRKSG